LPSYGVPGSGKTEVVGIKTVYELSKWAAPHSGIAVLTFTRNAADAINERIIGYGGGLASRHPHFVGTFDSWLHGYIFQPFGYRFTKYDGSSGDRRIKIIDDDSSAGFLHSFTAPIAGNHVPVLPTAFFFGVQGEPQTTDSTMESLIVDPNNSAALKCCKARFWKLDLRRIKMQNSFHVVFLPRTKTSLCALPADFQSCSLMSARICLQRN